MRYIFSWLPELIVYNSKETFEEYYQKIYEVFRKDFIETMPTFQGKNVGLQVEPKVNGKPQTFYHMTTEEALNDKQDKKERKIALDRCERIAWNKAILESSYVGLKIFPERRSHNRNNIVIWFQERDYVIILRDVKTYFVFITAYPIKYGHKKKRLQKSYDKYIKTKAETAHN